MAKSTGLFAPDGSHYVCLTNGSGSTLTPAGLGILYTYQVGFQATYTDKSSTITSGGNAQTLAAANSSRTGFFIQNVSTGDLWIRDGGTAAASQPSIWLPPGAYFEFPDTGIPNTALSIYGATTGQAFVAREW